MNELEEEKINLSPAQPYVPGEDAVVTATLTDYDDVKSYTYWQWYWTTTDTNLDVRNRRSKHPGYRRKRRTGCRCDNARKDYSGRHDGYLRGR